MVPYLTLAERSPGSGHRALCSLTTHRPLNPDSLDSRSSQSATLPATWGPDCHPLYTPPQSSTAASFLLLFTSPYWLQCVDFHSLGCHWVWACRGQTHPAVLGLLLQPAACLATWLLVMTSNSICKVKRSSLPKPVTSSHFPTAVNNGTKFSFLPPAHV